MSKTCPFCKREILLSDIVCPHCKRVVREEIRTNKDKDYSQQDNKHKDIKQKSNLVKTLKSFFKQRISNLQSSLNYNKYKFFNSIKKNKNLIIIILIIIFVLFLFISQSDKNASQIPVSVIPESVNYNDPTPTPFKDPKTFVSLSNGKIFYKNPTYLSGLGELNIKNGSDNDAIAKLVNTSTKKSIYTVYIKAKNDYFIKKISDGNYKLYFNLGNDWNEELKAFNTNSSFEVFDEAFDFNTTEYEQGDYLNTKYSSFEVTLNPVVGGQAKTEGVKDVEFGGY